MGIQMLICKENQTATTLGLFGRVVWEGLSEEVTFELRPRGGDGASWGEKWGKRRLD